MSARVLITLAALGPCFCWAVDPKPEVKETAEQFVTRAVADPKGTEARLKGKVVELTGAVSSAGPPYTKFGLTLSAGKPKPADASGLFADCEAPEAKREQVWLLAVGQKVKVAGELKSVEKDRVRLTNCEVTELEPNPIPTVKAADVAAAYAKDEKAATKTYGDRYATKELFVEGTVTGSKAGNYGTQVDLSGTDKLPVRVQVDPKEAEGLKAGDRVRLKATCRGYWPEEKAVLAFGRVLKESSEKK
jgi:hypothetical protein